MGIRERGEYRQKTLLLRAEIVEAARELFVKHGYESVSMRRIAEKIEYSPTTIYLYFKDKSELISAICEETFFARAELKRKIEKGGFVGARSRCGYQSRPDGLCRIRPQASEPLQKLVVLVVPAQDRAQCGVRGIGRDYQSYQILCKAVECGMDTGEIGAGDVAAVSQALWAAAHGVTLALLVAHRHFPFIDHMKLAKMR